MNRMCCASHLLRRTMEINKIKRIASLVIIVLSAVLLMCCKPDDLVAFLVLGLDIGLIAGCLADIARG